MIVPVLARPVLAETLYATVPLLVPLAPEVTVIQALLLTAVHGQPVSAVTVTLPLPPLAEGEALVGAIEYVQPLA